MVLWIVGEIISTVSDWFLPLHPPSASSRRSTLRIDHENVGTIRKCGTSFRIQRELNAMAFVRKHTTIPVPNVVDAKLRGCDSWMLMERAPGTRLDSAWPNMHENMKSTTIAQLKRCFEQLRNIRPSTSAWIGACDKGPVYDHRLNNGFPCGPFISVSEFHDFLVAPLTQCPQPELAAKYRKWLPDDCPINFAHADLSYEHIFVDEGTGNVTGIIDWEMAGFWPRWWEYRKAMYASRQQRWWIDVVDSVMPSYEKELEVDSDLEAF
jgi:aminoglycoside phosphotransferase (APT) family kinase protein